MILRMLPKSLAGKTRTYGLKRQPKKVTRKIRTRSESGDVV
jgi:hypothetical protein